MRDSFHSDHIQLLQSWSVGVAVTPGCTGGYSYAALSEPTFEHCFCFIKLKTSKEKQDLGMKSPPLLKLHV